MIKQVDLKCQWLALEETTAKVLRWLVMEGDRVEIDQDIMAMFLNGAEFVLPSPVDGMIKSILAEPGDLIEPDQVLAVFLVD
jgi:pyruvate/2-oxoglutarate dehydrogenase complex dihydrolipoamide acyltransferase (E2) component